MRPTSAPALAAAYFALQGVAVLAWWASLALRPDWRAPFAAAGAPEATLLAFAPPDLLLLVAGSWAAALGQRRGWRATPRLAAAVAGAAVYATAYVVALWVAGASSPLASLLMLPSAALSTWGALALSPSHAPRPLPPRRAGEHAAEPAQDGAAVQRDLGGDARPAPPRDP